MVLTDGQVLALVYFGLMTVYGVVHYTVYRIYR